MTFTYPGGALLGDRLRGAVGVAVALAPMCLWSLPLSTVLICSALGAGCGIFFARSLVKGRFVLTLHENYLEARPGGAILRRDGLRRVELAYFSTRADGRDGWMQLKLADEKTVLRVDSGLNGFEIVARWAATAAQRCRLAVDGPSLSNFHSLGIRLAVATGGAP